MNSSRWLARARVLLAMLVFVLPLAASCVERWPEREQAGVYERCVSASVKVGQPRSEVENPCSCAAGVVASFTEHRVYTVASAAVRDALVGEALGLCLFALQRAKDPPLLTRSARKKLRKDSSSSKPIAALKGWSLEAIDVALTTCEALAGRSSTPRKAETYCSCVMQWQMLSYGPEEAGEVVERAMNGSGKAGERFRVLGAMAACLYSTNPSPNRVWRLTPK